MQRMLKLCDAQGRVTGTEEFVKVHTDGLLHLAFSVYIFRRGMTEILIQKRADGKMLFRGMWANTCCSHPRDNEETAEAAVRRLPEECGFACDVEPVDTFVYNANDPEGRGVEHEHVTVFKGQVDDALEPKPNPEEIAEIKWVNVEALRQDMKDRPTLYAPWFHQGLPLLLSHEQKA